MEVLSDNFKTIKYSTYKKSNIPWLGLIPSHWEIQKGKWLFLKQDRPARNDDGIVTCFRDGEVTLRTNRKTEGFTIALKEHGYQGIRKGDLVIHNMDAFAGAIGVSDSDGKSTPVYSACTPRVLNRVNVYYYAYFLKDLAKSGFIESLAKGIRERSTDFRFNDFGLLLLSVPPLEEQAAIVDFLNRKIALIDQAINIKQKQIELLKERREILIHKAVTRGLNPNVQMKASGVEWIGEVPEHWGIKKLKFILKSQGRIGFKGYTTSDLVDKDEGALALGASHLDWDGNIITSEPVYISWKKYYESPEIMVSKNDIIIVQRGSTCGKVALIKNELGPTTINPSLVLLKEITENPEYVFLGIKVVLNGILNLVSKTAIPMLTQFQINNIMIPVPSIEEQKEIVGEIYNITRRLDDLSAIKEKEIEKLKEYKTTLINSVVTGKIKVS